MMPKKDTIEERARSAYIGAMVMSSTEQSIEKIKQALTQTAEEARREERERIKQEIRDWASHRHAADDIEAYETAYDILQALNKEDK